MERKKKVQNNSTAPEPENTVDDNEQTFITTPPDGGWGWVIVGASLISNIIVDGVSYSFGVFMDEFVNYFKASKSKTSLVGSVLAGTYLCAGPIVSAFTNRYGCRPVVIVGSVIGMFAFLLATLSPNVDILIVLYGGVGGFGLGLIYLPSIVSVGYYFDRKRAIATGIAVCGSGFGAFIFAPLGQFLLTMYDWKNALYIIAGLILNGAVCGALMRPLEPTNRKRKHCRKLAPREKNMIDRIKEQTKRGRMDSETSALDENTAIYETNTLFQKVQLAKLQRENQLNDDESELGSLPSTIFLKRQDSETKRPKKLSLSDHGTTTSQTSTPSELPKIVVTSKSPSLNSDTMTNESSKLQQDTTSGSQTASLRRQDFEQSNLPRSNTHISSKVTTPQKGQPFVDISPSPSSSFLVSPEESFVSGINLKKENSSHRPIIGSMPNSLPTETKQSNIPLLAEDRKLLVKHNKDGTKEYWNRSTDFAAASNFRSNKDLVIAREEYARPLYRKDIFYSGSIIHIPQFQSQPDMNSYITSITTIPGTVEVDRECWLWDYVCLPKAAKDTLREMLDFSLLFDPAFGIVCFANILVFLGYFIPFVFLRDRATEELNITPEKSAFLLSLIGIANTVGRIMSGVIADMRKVDSLIINNVSLILAGIATAMSPLCKTFSTLCTYAVVFGLNASAFISLTSIIICDLLGLDKLTNAFGLLSLVRGISTILGPPLAGAIYDATNSYHLPFILGGILIIIGGVLHFLLFVPQIAKRRKKFQREIRIDLQDCIIEETAEDMPAEEEQRV